MQLLTLLACALAAVGFVLVLLSDRGDVMRGVAAVMVGVAVGVAVIVVCIPIVNRRS